MARNKINKKVANKWPEGRIKWSSLSLRESIHLVNPLVIYSKTILTHYIIFSGPGPRVWTSVIQISRGKTKCAPSNRTTSVSSDEIGTISENLKLDKFDESISRMNV